MNTTLERNNHTVRVDHRSYERQGNGIVLTVYMGAAATQMEKRGIRTELGGKNREAAISLFLIEAFQNDLKRQRKTVPANSRIWN